MVCRIRLGLAQHVFLLFFSVLDEVVCSYEHYFMLNPIPVFDHYYVAYLKGRRFLGFLRRLNFGQAGQAI